MAGIVPMSTRQAEQISELRERWKEFEHLSASRKAYAGGVTWKEVKGNVYLTRFWTQGGQKHFRYEGKRSAKTERQYAAFVKERDAIEYRLKIALADLDEASRVAKALRLGRIPVGAAELLRAVARAGFGKRVLGIDDTCLAAYEAATCMSLPAFPGVRGSLTWVVDSDVRRNVVDLIRKVGARHGLHDAGEGGFRSEGELAIELLDDQAFAKRLLDRRLTDEQHEAVRWALDADAFIGMGVGRDGSPVPLRVLDPRAYVLCMLGAAVTAGRTEASPAITARVQAVVSLVRDHGFGEGFQPRHAGSFEELAGEGFHELTGP